MYSYDWDEQTGGIILNHSPLAFSKEPRPVYYKELDILGFNKYWEYQKQEHSPYMWAEANNYFYRGRKVAQTKGGTLYTAPELVLLEEPEPNHAPLQAVDIAAMVEKNKEIMESLVQETIKKAYNTYIQYRNKVDVFHVSYSGGKDSEVTFDIIQRALPHNAFIVIFADTKMEFPDTYKVIEKTKQFCLEHKIGFYIAKPEFNPLDSWRLFGPPSSAIRWCCGVHKTAPQLLKLREITGKSDVQEMAFVGVRSSESIRRNGYDYISFSTKHSGQYSFNPILDWNSAEVYLYMYMQNLVINEAYKKGSSRAGCLFCPMATSKSIFFNYNLYKNNVQPYIDIIQELYSGAFSDKKLIKSYIENKGWNARKNGRDITIGIGDFNEENEKEQRIITLKCKNDSWKQWIKIVGYLDYDDNKYTLHINDSIIFHFKIEKLKDNYLKFIFHEKEVKKNIVVFKNVKDTLKKSHSCIACRYCESNCPHGNIHFVDKQVVINDSCIKCGLCNRIDNGCLLYNSLILPKGMGKMKKGSIDEYGTHPPKMEWIKEFIKYKENFNEENSLGRAMLPMFRKFLRDAGIVDRNNTWNAMTTLLFETKLETQYLWAIMLCNLAYAPQVGWLIKHIDFNTNYSQAELKDMLSNYISSKTGPVNIANSYRTISKLPFSDVGFGSVTATGKEGFVFTRKAWQNPDPRVILYALYKFAEACGGYYQFTLTRLLNHSIDSDGVSPTEIFGLEREQMEKILNGLTANYPDYINATFTLDLDNINLYSEKSSDDVLTLF